MQTSFYIVATPIGNLGDITTRAMQILGDVDFIAAEDTRHTGQMLAYFGIKKPLISFRDAPTPVMELALNQIKQRIAKGETGAYVTDAGTPGVSDPAWRLVKMLVDNGIIISPIPGSSAVTALLSVANYALDEYRFLGFLPKKKGYQTKLKDITDYLQGKEMRAVILYESPNRIRKTLTDMHTLLPGAQSIIGRELTKKFETIYRSQLTPEFISSLPEKGEYVVLLSTPLDSDKVEA
jgi:16S rRNA (cytidine1402-2'-O)-methyltransferase